MKISSINDILTELERLMHGCNYQATFGIDVFDNCQSLDEFRSCLKKQYPSTDPETVTSVLISADDLWSEVNYALNYRGDANSGLSLTQKTLYRLDKAQTKYKDLISQFLSENASIYNYPSEKGIPGYPVFWDYRFIIFTERNVCLFLYGSSSD